MTQPIVGPQNFRDESDAISGSWWNGPNGTRLRYSMSILFDDAAQMTIYAVQAQAPSLAPADALPFISTDRKIYQGYQESNASLRARQIQWLDRWAYSGKSTGVLLGARGWILPQMPQIAVITNFGQWWGYAANVDPMPAGAQTVTPATIATAPPGHWNWDGAGSSFWARAWLVVWSTGVVWATPEANTWGTGTWGDGGAWGFSQLPSVFSGLTAAVATFKGKHALYPAVIVSFDDTWYQVGSVAGKLPDGTWGAWHKVVGGVAVASRDQTVSRFVTGAA